MLLARARNGDQHAFAVLVERYGDMVVSLCFASTLNTADAEELTQDVFLAAWRGLPHFRGDAAFSTWLFRLARNACIDRSRRNATRPRSVAIDDMTGAASPAIDDAARLTAQRIMQLAGTLSVPLREAVLLRDLQGLSYEEIAAMQEVPIGTVRSRIATARSSIATALDES